MNKIYALIEDELVTNTIIWNGNDSFKLKDGVTIVEIPIQNSELPTPGIGWGYVNGKFIDPEYHAEDS
ncbi:hypothetical protein [Escherichia coli]|uniref:hypothetical protein n=1 Tax=Escherichia coli TaxID=562 RepID=UPI0015EA6285|nr:hypothetical protein [Escherichia coli]MCK2666919.1 hypothetical protein [Escherichia coli]QML82602.1 hypothetical protein HVX26_08460 [Escherichia coli]QML91707.1 hypothetical protein HVX24_08460 [Escherichia coli]HAJ4486704.1 hypothetical protein [Escherichia coli]